MSVSLTPAREVRGTLTLKLGASAVRLMRRTRRSLSHLLSKSESKTNERMSSSDGGGCLAGGGGRGAAAAPGGGGAAAALAACCVACAAREHVAGSLAEAGGWRMVAGCTLAAAG